MIADQNPIPGKILILLDTHNLSVRQKLPYPDLPKMANGNGKWQMWQCLIWAIFDIQTSHGCLKVSEFYQESDSEDENHLRQFLKSEIKLLCFCEFLPCNSRRQPSFLNRKKLGLLTDPRCINISSLSYWQGVLAM